MMSSINFKKFMAQLFIKEILNIPSRVLGIKKEILRNRVTIKNISKTQIKKNHAPLLSESHFLTPLFLILKETNFLTHQLSIL